MRRLPLRTIPAVLLATIAAAASAAGSSRDVVIDASDVDRFFAVLHRTRDLPAASDLQHDYLDAGSPGLQTFVERRQLTATGIREAIAARPALFANAQACAARIPAIRMRLRAALDQLASLYADATVPPVTFLIGRGRTGGTTSKAGVLIGLETICSTDVLEPDLEDRLVHLVAHEYVHVQQPRSEGEGDDATLLEAALLEGGAEFVGELISGGVSYGHLQRWTRGRERAIDDAFVADRDRIDKDRWLWSGMGTPAEPGDLGYWVGYRIVKAYWLKAPDRTQALKDILLLTDPQDFLERSGWAPGDP